MNSHVEKVNRLLESNGWEIVEKREVSFLWVAEIWKIRSTWSPTDCVAYLSFEVDPQNDPREFNNVGWMKATSFPPIDWNKEDEAENKKRSDFRASCPLGRGRDKYLKSFFADLSKIRDDCGVNA